MKTWKSPAFTSRDLILSNEKLYEAFEQALALTKKTLNDEDGWHALKGTTYKGNFTFCYFSQLYRS